MLREAGVTYLKIAGRGAPTTAKLRDIGFLAAAMAMSHGKGPRETAAYAQEIIRLRFEHYGHTCGPEDCYYEV